jgi:Kef-type K+ transport system membrane component KefB
MHPSADSIAHVALLVAVVLVSAKLGGEGASRLKQPPVLGELFAGLVIGNLPFSFFHDLGSDRYVDMLAQLGVMILLFEVGLESTVQDVLAVGKAAVRVALLGTLGTFAAGYMASRFLLRDASAISRVFVAAAICATSVGITARVLKDLGKMRSNEARTILGAAIVDDILGLVILALVSGWARSRESGTTPTAGAIVWLVAKTLALLAISVAVSVRVTPRIFALAARLRAPGALLAVGLSFCFSLAWAADAMGLAPIVGAFAAGLVLEDLHSAKFVERGEKSLSELVKPISEFLVPIFFVVMGIRADIHAFFQPMTVVLAVALTIAAVIGKLACALGAGRGVNKLAVAFGMVPRGEVTLIFVSLGSSLGAVGPNAYSAVVTTVILTTLVTPLALKWSFGRSAAGAPA